MENNNHMTIEDLAVMVKRGFDTMATKDDLCKLEQRMGEIDQRMATKEDLREIWEALDATHGDVRYIRGTVDTLIHSDVAQDDAIKDLTSRTHRLEQKAGFT